MSLFISSLNSGSNGNCYYIGNDEEAVLVDVGISCKEIEKRMKRLNLDLLKVKAVFISHEHIDHVSGLCGLIKKYRIPVYITSATYLACRFQLQENLVKTFSSAKPAIIGNLTITAFQKSHDACDPYSFIIKNQEVTVGILTDIGTPCANLITHFKQCNAAFLEANFDDEMLETGNYPFHLKRRIRGGKGHLSNQQALSLFQQHKPCFMSHLVLSHLSKNNNCPQLVERLFNEIADGVNVIVASRYEETAVYQIDTKPAEASSIKPRRIVKQLAFSFA